MTRSHTLPIDPILFTQAELEYIYTLFRRQISHNKPLTSDQNSAFDKIAEQIYRE